MSLFNRAKIDRICDDLTVMLWFSRPTPEKLVRHLKDLPPAPKVLHRLQKMMADESTSLVQIGALLRLEPGLFASVMRMAKSAHFSRGRSVETIEEAVQRVGMQGVHELVTYAVASQLLGRRLQIYGLEAQQIWSRSVACAIAASDLAGRAGVERSLAYTAGLMHNVGLLAIDLYLSKQKQIPVLKNEGYPCDWARSEKALLDFSHAEVGAALLEMWEFPDQISQAVAHQLSPEGRDKLTMLLAVARWARSVIACEDEILPELPEAGWMESVGIELKDFDGWLNGIRRTYRLAKDELGLSA